MFSVILLYKTFHGFRCILIMKDKIIKPCDFCKTRIKLQPSKFYRQKKHYCSNMCYLQGRENNTISECIICHKKIKQTPTKMRVYCSRACTALSKINRVTIKCNQCGIEKQQIPSHVKSTNFCNSSCKSKYFIKLRKGFKKSFAEIFLLNLIKTDFNNLTIFDNVRSILPSGLEIDIFIPDVNLAIELNGPCHYFNIYGADTLNKVQNRDLIKQTEIQQLGFKFIVLNISMISCRTKLKKFLLDQYINNIKPILSNL